MDRTCASAARTTSLRKEETSWTSRKGGISTPCPRAAQVAPAILEQLNTLSVPSASAMSTVQTPNRVIVFAISELSRSHAAVDAKFFQINSTSPVT